MTDAICYRRGFGFDTVSILKLFEGGIDMMKRLVGICVSLFCVNVSAQSARESAVSPSTHSVFGNLGLNRGGVTMGVGYEHMLDAATGIGGHLRWFAKDDGTTNPSNGLLILGGFAGHHFYKKSWDLSFGPSFNIINIESVRAGTDDETTLGLSISLLWAVNSNVSIGFDNARYWVWFNDDYAGQIVDDLSFRVRAGF